MSSAARHRCMIYEGSPAVHLPWLATQILQRVSAGERCFYLNSPPMVAGLRSYLAATGFNIEAHIAIGSLILSSSQDHLVENRFDTKRMLDFLNQAIADAQRDGYDSIWMSGDMTWEFGNERNLEELLTYERALEDLFHQEPMLSGVCQYHRDTLPTKAIRDALCTHQSVYLNETLFRVNPYFSRSVKSPNADIPSDIGDLITRFSQYQ